MKMLVHLLLLGSSSSLFYYSYTDSHIPKTTFSAASHIYSTYSARSGSSSSNYYSSSSSSSSSKSSSSSSRSDFKRYSGGK